MNKKKQSPGNIAQNKKARHEFSLEDKFEAGLELQGWEVKSIRAGKASISESYVTIDKGEAYLLGCRIQPLNQASSHVICDPERPKKLLLKRRELDKLMGARDRQGYSIVATSMYWKACWVKVEIYLAKGKQAHDKRDTVKDRDWARQKERMMKHSA
ncbi:SsrA-binding protein SmpB [Alteromonas oceanisediminis]|uniref:SsrA-binding protein SmpB n=1 Tax=Alteromonas oceanisediminis TaxID=2836180 RepID=UPI001BD98D29|nr:SsrA-binding protein SmpB [Alteromonas oceanisediminis]MBT0586593.1 SsrA-binding protein SmpB [Alteromonas oceanisediminis]